MAVKKGKEVLTSRETEITKLLCREKSNAEIAEMLGISINGVKFHIKNIYKKTRCNGILSLYKYALKQGLARLKLGKTKSPVKKTTKRQA